MMPGMDGWAVLARAQGRPRARRHPGHHDDDGRRPEPRLRAGRRRLPHQADRPRAPGRSVLRSTAGAHAGRCWSSRTTPTTREMLRAHARAARAGRCAEAEQRPRRRSSALREARARPDPARPDDAGDGRLRVRRRAAPRRSWRAHPRRRPHRQGPDAEDRERLNGHVEHDPPEGRATAATSCSPRCASWSATHAARAPPRDADGDADGQDPAGRGQRDEPRHAVAAARSAAATRSSSPSTASRAWPWRRPRRPT